MLNRVRVAVVGATGYGGAELVRLLLGHTHVEIVAVTSSRAAGERLDIHCPWLRTDLVLSSFDPVTVSAEIVFLAQEHGFAFHHAPTLVERGIKVIDLSADFRLRDNSVFNKYYQSNINFSYDNNRFSNGESSFEVAYGLPELTNRDSIKNAQVIANPGCYPTATLLALKPLYEAGLVSATPVIDAKSGVSGAGRAKNSSEYLFNERSGSFVTYGVTGHRHTPEISQGLGVPVRFTPHLIPTPRGMEVTCYVALDHQVSKEDVISTSKSLYVGSPFVHVVNHLPETKHVIGTNRCDIAYAVDKETNFLIATSVIDNLGKGAAGQAVQNMNIMCGFDETIGLPLHGVWP
jgi:N-acetyl-gamma-glutamyl-phosphate reductase